MKPAIIALVALLVGGAVGGGAVYFADRPREKEYLGFRTLSGVTYSFVNAPIEREDHSGAVLSVRLPPEQKGPSTLKDYYILTENGQWYYLNELDAHPPSWQDLIPPDWQDNPFGLFVDVKGTVTKHMSEDRTWYEVEVYTFTPRV